MSSTEPDSGLIILAQRVHSLARSALRSDTLVIANGRIVASGTRRRLLPLRRRGTRVLNLARAVVTPGLVDAHTHFFYWALNRLLVADLSALPSLNATLHQMHAHARRRGGAEWILGRGFDHNRWATGLPTATDLDDAFPNDPVMIHSRDGHTAWLNTAALRRAGISRHSPDPKGGSFVRDARGRLTGIVREAALSTLPDPVRDFARRTDTASRQVIDRALASAYAVAWQHGLVGVHSMDDGPSLAHLCRHRTSGRLGLRVVHAIPLSEFPHAVDLGLRSGMGDDWLRLGGVKMFADGALGSQSAYMLDAYPGRPGYHGVPVVAGAELVEAVRNVARHGWPAWIHAIGDRAVREATRAIAAARRIEHGPAPHRIEHVQCIRANDIRALARAKIVASMQPCHILGDIPIADRHWPRARRDAYVFRRLLDAGVTLAAGSDVPIESIDPRRSWFAATVRTDEAGRPAGGWFPDQRISAAEILNAFTRGAATAAGDSGVAGTLTPGARADLTIWGADPLEVPATDLLRVPILGCVVGGHVHLTEPN